MKQVHLYVEPGILFLDRLQLARGFYGKSSTSRASVESCRAALPAIDSSATG